MPKGHLRCHIEILLKGCEDGDAVGLEGRTVATAGDGSADLSVFRVAIRSTAVLSIEGKIVDVSLTNTLCSALISIGTSAVERSEPYGW